MSTPKERIAALLKQREEARAARAAKQQAENAELAQQQAMAKADPIDVILGPPTSAEKAAMAKADAEYEAKLQAPAPDLAQHDAAAKAKALVAAQLPEMVAHQTAAQLVAADAAKLPETFGLKGFPGLRFKVDLKGSFVADDCSIQLRLNVEREGKWVMFARDRLMVILPRVETEE